MSRASLWAAPDRPSPATGDSSPHDLALRARIEALEQECGCQSGALAGLTAVVLYAGSLLLLGLWPGSWAVAVGVGVAAFLLAVAIGKHLALERAARERELLLRRLGA